MEVSQGLTIFLNSLEKKMNNYIKKYANDTKIASVAKIKTDHSVLQKHVVILSGRVINWKVKFTASNLHNAHVKNKPRL